MHYLARRPLPWLAVCIVAAILLAAEKSSESAHATIGHQFGYPFCAQQPYVLAGFDHSFPHLQEIVPKNPTAESNRLVTYYNNDVRIDCGEAEFQTNYSNPSGPCWRYDGHAGWDYKLTATNGGIEGAIGYAPVYAADDGTVQYAGREDPLNDLEPYGQMIQIAHADEGNGEFDSEYLHLEAMFVETGADVEKGAIIGLSGMTGAAGAMPHLHFQVREHRNNPEGGGAETLYQPWFPYFDPYGWDTDYTGAAQAAATPSAPDPWPTTFHGSGPGGTPPGPAAISEGRRLILPSAPDNMNVCPIKCAPVNVPPIVVDDSDEGFTVISGDWTVRTGAGENNEFRVTRPSGITDTITAEVDMGFWICQYNRQFCGRDSSPTLRRGHRVGGSQRYTGGPLFIL